VPFGRRLLSGISGAAALAPALVWLAPALLARRAPSFRDQGDFFYPLKLYTADRLRAGEIPLWNPLSGTGEPWLANGQSGVFYPPTLLFLLHSAALAGALFLLLHFAIAAWGARRFLKEETVSDAGALFGAAAYAASGMAASLAVYWNHFGAWAYLPGIAALARSGLRSRAATLGFGALVGLQAMAGSPEISAATVVLAGALVWSPREEFPEPLSPQPRSARIRRFAAGVGLGLALAAWVIVPMAELAMHSERRHAFSAGERDAGAVGWRDAGTMSGFTPASFGGSYLATLFLPPFVLVAAAAAFQEDHRRRLALLLAVFAALGILLAAAGPPGVWLRGLAPLDRVRYPAKWLAWSSFGIAALAGLGFDALRFASASARGRALFGAASVAALGAAALSPLPPPVRLCCCVGAAALGFLALGLGRRPLAGSLLGAAAAAGLVGALALALRPLPRFAPESQVTSCPESVIPLARVPGRVITPPMGALWGWVLRDGSFDGAMLARQREALLGYTNLPCRVPTVRTAAPLPTAAAVAIGAAIGPAEDALPAGAAGARVLWTPFAPSRLPSKKIGDFYRAPLAPYLPRLAFVRGYRVEPDAGRAWARVASGEVDLTREVLLDRRPVPDPAGPEEHPMLLARLVEDAPERVVAELTASFPGLLVLADLDYPGWVAEEGGRRLPILKADGYFRAVALPAGVHRVEFRYRPMSFYAGAGISVIALLVALGLWHAGEPALTRRRA
jgi:hypothetical protein